MAKRPIQHADGCRCGGDHCKQREVPFTYNSDPAPGDRRYFLTVLGRIEFEVSEEEYQRAIAATFKMDQAEGPASMSFHTGLIDGFFKDPKKEEVLVNAERT